MGGDDAGLALDPGTATTVTVNDLSAISGGTACVEPIVPSAPTTPTTLALTPSTTLAPPADQSTGPRTTPPGARPPDPGRPATNPTTPATTPTPTTPAAPTPTTTATPPPTPTTGAASAPPTTPATPTPTTRPASDNPDHARNANTNDETGRDDPDHTRNTTADDAGHDTTDRTTGDGAQADPLFGAGRASGSWTADDPKRRDAAQSTLTPVGRPGTSGDAAAGSCSPRSDHVSRESSAPMPMNVTISAAATEYAAVRPAWS